MTCAALLTVTYFMQSSFVRLLVIGLGDIILLAPMAYYFVFSAEEKRRIKQLILPLVDRIRK